MTDLLEFINMSHVVAVEGQVTSPVQPAKTAFPVALARRVTVVPLWNAWLHVLPQLMPDGLLVTVPFVVSPLLLTLNV